MREILAILFLAENALIGLVCIGWFLFHSLRQWEIKQHKQLNTDTSKTELADLREELAYMKSMMADMTIEMSRTREREPVAESQERLESGR